MDGDLKGMTRILRNQYNPYVRVSVCMCVCACSVKKGDSLLMYSSDISL